jgi:hypothetical protein
MTMRRIVPITATDRMRQRLAAIVGPTETQSEPVVPTITIARAERTIAPPTGSARFDALERLPGYWRGRAAGRQAAIDFYRSIACQREVTPGVDVSMDGLRDQQAVAEYERRAERC